MDIDPIDLEFAFHRAAGSAQCADCGRAYGAHAYDLGKLDHYSRPFLRVLCDGRRVLLTDLVETWVERSSEAPPG